MTFVRLLWRVELAALSALLLCSILLSICAFLESAWWAAEGKTLLLDPPDAMRLVGIYAVLFGVLPVLLLGAPAYTWLKYKRRASSPLVVALGACPGLAILPLDSNLGTWFVACGMLVATLTHVLSKRFES